MRSPWRERLIVALVLGLSVLCFFRVLIGRDLTRTIPIHQTYRTGTPEMARLLKRLSSSDQRFVPWLTARNAWTLLHRPLHLFDAEPCFPAERTLALGEPGFSLGFLGVPGWILSGDPIFTHDFALFLLTFAAALAMYLLVRDWTGEPVAGLVAAIGYAFAEFKAGDVVHPYVYDTAWIVLALFFARRLFEGGRHRDALGLAASIVMQVGGSLYPLVAAVLIAVPFLVWGGLRHGLRGQRLGPWLLVAAVALGWASFVFVPYLELAGTGVLAERRSLFFVDSSFVAPGGIAFPGWIVSAMAILGLGWPVRSVWRFCGRDPRWAIVVAALLVFVIATAGTAGQGDQIFVVQEFESQSGAGPIYGWLMENVPGFSVLRSPGAIICGLQPLVCILAGFGVAGLLRRLAPRPALAAALALVCLGWVESLRPEWLGMPVRLHVEAREIRPEAELFDLFDGIERAGQEGPFLEIPVNAPFDLLRRARAVLLTAYHHQRTSQCYNSYMPPELEAVSEIAKRLPGPDALAEIADLGFRTVIVHHPPGDAFFAGVRDAWDARAAASEDLARIHANAWASAYALPRTANAAEDEAR